jgi:hypothetical protein
MPGEWDAEEVEEDPEEVEDLPAKVTQKEAMSRLLKRSGSPTRSL